MVRNVEMLVRRGFEAKRGRGMAESQRILCAVRRVLFRVGGSWLVISVVAFTVRVAFVVDQAHRVPAIALASVPFQNEV